MPPKIKGKKYIYGDYASAYPLVNAAESEVYIIVKKSERLLECGRKNH